MCIRDSVCSPHCPVCGVVIKQQALDQIIDKIMSLEEGTRVQILAPVIRGRKGEYQKLFEDYKRSGYVRVRVDGSIYDLQEEIKLDKNKKHNIELVVDRIVVREEVRKRLADSCETAARLSNGLVLAAIPVSYTHLDVYKRQVLITCSIRHASSAAVFLSTPSLNSQSESNVWRSYIVSAILLPFSVRVI